MFLENNLKNGMLMAEDTEILLDISKVAQRQHC